MDIYFKNILDDEEFKMLSTSESVNLNAALLKIVCKTPISELTIDDECIKLNHKGELKNEFIYHKLNTSNKSYIEILATGINKNEKYKRIIKLDRDSYIYNKNEIEKIRLRGNAAYNNIINFMNQYENQNFSELLLNDFEQILVNPEDIIKSIRKIIKLATDIIKNPKVQLKSKEIVKSTNKVKIINSNSARYFAMHSEDWYQEGENFPKPLNILTESFEEDKDIYENQVIKFILNYTRKIIIKLIDNIEMYINTLKCVLVENKGKLSENLYEDELLQLQMDIEEEQKSLSKNKIILNEFKNIKEKIIDLLNCYKDISFSKHIKIKMTQVILYDKRYLKVINLFKKDIKNIYFNNEEINKVEGSIDYNYMFILCDIICRVLYYLGFKGINNIDIPSTFEKLFNDKKTYKIKCNHIKESLKCEIELYGLESDYPNQLILKLNYKSYTKTIKFIINYMDVNKNIDENYTENLYNIDNNYKSDTTLLLNTIPLDKINFKNEETKEKEIYKLSNLGNNFISKKDYDKYGGFKKGCIQLNMYDLNKLYNQLTKFLRLSFIKLNFFEYCTFCQQGDYIKDKNSDIYTCSICGKKIAINKCQCGSKIVKFLSYKENLNNVELDKIENAIERHQTYEIYSNNLGSCYSNVLGNTGGFCSTCGRCKKISNKCIRCNMINWEEYK